MAVFLPTGVRNHPFMTASSHKQVNMFTRLVVIAALVLAVRLRLQGYCTDVAMGSRGASPLGLKHVYNLFKSKHV